MDTVAMHVLDTPLPPRTSPGRIAAIDIARGIALLGMMIVHLAFVSEESLDWAFLLEAPSGRAAVLFFILSGLSLSVIARRGAHSAQPAVLLKRGVVLLLAGVVMRGFFEPTILAHYGAVFLMTPWLLKRSNRFLGGLAAAALIAGPVITLWFSWNLTAWGGQLVGGMGGVTGWAVGVVGALLFDSYPLAVWIGFFAIGMLVGRTDLGNHRVAARLLAAGVALVVVSTVTIQLTDHFLPSEDGSEFSSADSEWKDETISGTAPTDASAEEWKFDPYSEKWAFEWTHPQWTNLVSGAPHSNATPWALQSSGIALSVIGLLALAPAVLIRFLGPLAALGSISLTAYVFHAFLIVDVWFWLDLLGPDSFSWEMGRLALLTAAMLGLGWVVKRHWKQGPLEWSLHRLTQEAVASTSTPGSERPIPVA
jgi:uncharacterized protein